MPLAARTRLGLSSRCGRIVQSEIRAMSVECERLGGINLSQGVCDMPVPGEVLRGAEEGMDAGINSYTRYDGLPELRAAIARKLREHNGIEADPEREVVVSCGSTGSFYCACLALLDPGDEVILFEPYYGYHVNTLLSVEAAPTFVRLAGPDWSFTEEDLERTLSAKTKAVIVNTPANPSGKVFTEDELGRIASFAARHDLFIFTDEIYEHILYDGRRHLSPATLPGARERTITISGLSKTFSITGWRIGYSHCDARWAQMIGYMNDLVYVCAPAPLQAGVARGLAELDRGYYDRMRAEFAAKRESICSALARAGLAPIKPQGAYYVLADISRLPGATGKERAMDLLRRTGVASVPGEAFFHRPEDGARLARFCFAKTDSELLEACRRLEAL